MTDLIDPHHGGSAGAVPPADPAEQRRARQARIALLRNPNRKPLPPPRRPPLLGRSMRLRSARRPDTPVPSAVFDDAPDGAAQGETLIRDSEGRILRIDLDRLEQMTRQIEPAHKLRSAYGAHVLGNSAQSETAQDGAPTGGRDLPPIRDRLADPLAEAGEAAPPPAAWRRLIRRLTGW